MLQPPLKQLVSPFTEMDGDDTRETKTALQSIGRYTPPEWGISPYPDEKMFDGLAGLQRESGLRPDREMKPGGPTHTMLNAELDRQRRGNRAPQPRIADAVGDAAPNNASDVRTVRSGLASLKLLPDSERDNPKSRFDADSGSALAQFQERFNLKPDRLARPNRPTIERLNRASAPFRGRHTASRHAAPASNAPNRTRADSASAAPHPAQSTQPARPPIFDRFHARDAIEWDNIEHLKRLSDLLHRDQPLNETDDMLGTTVLKAFGRDRLPQLSKKTAGKLFRLAHFADRDENVADVWDAVADPDFPVRRGRFTLANGETVELTQTEANGDTDQTRRFAMVDPDRLHQRPHNGGDLLTGGLMMGGPRGVRPRTGVNIPNQSANEEHEEEAEGEEDSDNYIEGRIDNIPVEDGASEESRDTLVTNTQAIRHKGSQEALLDELTDGVAEIETDEGTQKTKVSINTNKPREAADTFIEKIAETNETEIRESENGLRIVIGKDGTRYTVYPERKSNSGRGVDIVVSLPNKGRKPGRGHIKLTYGRPER